MVDQALLKELQGKLDAGPEDIKAEDTLRVFEFFKQIAAENEEMQEELEDLDLVIQIEITDLKTFFWLTVKDGKIDYGKGDIENPTFLFSTSMEIALGMIFGKTDATSEYMAGNVAIEGSLPDAMSFQGIIELAMELFEELTEE
ncbi:MAG: SCP2 sterol-binding domain-containing protein [Candidatus Hodarchaeota archaeon]